MKPLLLCLATACSFLLLQAQDKPTVFKDFRRTHYWVEPNSTIEKEQDLPAHIQDILTGFLDQRLGAYANNLIFHSAYRYDLDAIAQTNPEVLDKNRNNLLVIPYYDVEYIFKNEELGIQQYWLNIKLDKHGQVLKCNFPSMKYNNSIIVPSDSIKTITDSLLDDTLKYLKTAPIELDLEYDLATQSLNWELCYLKYSTQDSKSYSCFTLNAHNGSLIRQEGMLEQRMNFDCDCQVEPVIIGLEELPEGEP